jgi:hypothetical protein
MPSTPEQQARIEIDKLLTAAGWQVFDLKDANIHAARGVAVPLLSVGEQKWIVENVKHQLAMFRAAQSLVCINLARAEHMCNAVFASALPIKHP